MFLRKRGGAVYATPFSSPIACFYRRGVQNIAGNDDGCLYIENVFLFIKGGICKIHTVEHVAPQATCSLFPKVP